MWPGEGPHKGLGSEQGPPCPVLGLALVGTQEDMCPGEVSEETEIWRKELGNEIENIFGLERRWH